MFCYVRENIIHLLNIVIATIFLIEFKEKTIYFFQVFIKYVTISSWLARNFFE